jgi:hypothetical protein
MTRLHSAATSLGRLAAPAVLCLGLAACAPAAAPAGDAVPGAGEPSGAAGTTAMTDTTGTGATTAMTATGATGASGASGTTAMTDTVGSSSAAGAAGTYAGGLPAADAEARLITLVLLADGTATLSTEYVGKGTFLQTGTWQQAGTNVSTTFTTQDGNTLANPETFEWELVDGNLANRGWDRTAYGDDGFGVLLRQP